MPWKNFSPRGKDRFSMCCLISVENAKELERFGDWLLLHEHIRTNSTYSITTYGLDALLAMAKRIQEK